jgi:hypothetical protein
MRLAFDSRPTADQRELGHYSRCLLRALRDTAGEQDEILEASRPRGVEVFHTPWMQGAMLHSPCPMVVTVHDLTALKRPSERLRGGGMHLRLRHLAVQRATHVIVPCEVVAGEAVVELGLDRERVIVIPAVPDPAVSDTAVPDPAVSALAAPDFAPPDPAEIAAGLPGAVQPTWTWEDAARETWAVYRQALAQPHRPCVTGPKRRPSVSERGAGAPPDLPPARRISRRRAARAQPE